MPWIPWRWYGYLLFHITEQLCSTEKNYQEEVKKKQTKHSPPPLPKTIITVELIATGLYVTNTDKLKRVKFKEYKSACGY